MNIIFQKEYRRDRIEKPKRRKKERTDENNLLCFKFKSKSKAEIKKKKFRNEDRGSLGITKEI